MKILNRGILKDFAEKHQNASDYFWAWFYDVSEQEWRSPLHVREIYATADPIPNDRVVFNIRGNRYRIVVAVNYQKGLVLIRWIGTHAEYDRIDAEKI